MKKTLIALAALCLFACNSSTEPAKTEMSTIPDSAGVKSKILPDTENQSTRDIIKAYEDGNLEAFLAPMADSVKIYYPGPGDSLVGKDALKQFFKLRQDSVVSAKMEAPVFLAVDSQDNIAVAPGKWLMSWYLWNIKYKNGKTALFNIQATHHINAAGKVDIGIWYYDVARAQGNAPKAMK